MRNKKDQLEGAFAEPPTVARLSPMDVQQKEFGVTRVGGGYKMRDVDEFLDQLTNSMTVLVEENRRLKEQAGSGAMIGAPDLDEVARQADEIISRARAEAAQIIFDAQAERPAERAVPTSGDRAAISAFLVREREFLQSLAGLVQGHAEAVKGMAKDARDAAVSAMPPAATPVERPAPAPASAVEPARDDAGMSASEPTPDPSAAEAEPAATVEPAPSAEAEPAVTVDQPTQAMEEPVRIEEPEPATVGRAESEDPNENEEGDRSLRDLFWGED